MVIERDEGPLVTPWVTLVGHDLMSDALVTGASALAQKHHTGLTFHLSPSVSDGEQYLARTGLRPAVHLRQLEVLGPHVLIGHGVHIDDDELEAILETDTAVAACPWAYLRLGQARPAPFVTSICGLAVGGWQSGATPRTPVTRSMQCELLRCLPALRKTFRWTRQFSRPIMLWSY